jgi:hypothetical protein
MGGTQKKKEEVCEGKLLDSELTQLGSMYLHPLSLVGFTPHHSANLGNLSNLKCGTQSSLKIQFTKCQFNTSPQTEGFHQNLVSESAKNNVLIIDWGPNRTPEFCE